MLLGSSLFNSLTVRWHAHHPSYDLYAVQLDLYTVGDKGRKLCDHFKS